MPNTFNYNLNEVAFALIETGEKQIEGRLFKNSFTKIKKDDVIIFKNKDNFLKVRVVKTARYNTFKEMLINEQILRVTPLSKSLNESVSIYRKFYSEKDELKYGVLAITIEK